MKKIVSLMLSLVMVISVFAGFGVTANAAEIGTWHKNSTGWWFEYGDGAYLQNELAEIDGQTYYFNEEGYMITGWRFIDNAWYHFNDSGCMQTGWQHIDGKDYFFFCDDGQMATDTFIDVDYVNEDGVWIPNRWIKDSNGWWYQFGDGDYFKDDLAMIDGQIYMFDENGYMVTGWRYYETEFDPFWIYFAPSGVALKDWQFIDGNWYYLKDYEAVQGDWLELNGKWFYFNDSCKMITGWQFVDDSWYYFNGSGYMQTGWQHIDGKDYFFFSTGKMAVDTYIGGYYVDANGVWVPGA